ncbi:twin-arginine translocase subunit TatC, partial [Desulfococcus sp.]|uniref:twin-arginine translocase subunit TatC n=1 Tax=Desulfococcus sp. TaxID=2025834 RepID=UPI003D1412BD
YLSFSAKLLIAFGLAFELPLVLTGMARMGIVTDVFLKKNRKYAILLFFVGAAIVTPPDVVSQVLLAVPLMALYELSIVGAKVFQPKKAGEEAAEAEGKPPEADTPKTGHENENGVSDDQDARSEVSSPKSGEKNA